MAVSFAYKHQPYVHDSAISTLRPQRHDLLRL